MSQDDLAKAVRLQRTSITNIEQGSQRVLLHILLDLAEALKCPYQDLVPTREQLLVVSQSSAILSPDQESRLSAKTVRAIKLSLREQEEK